MVPSPVPSALTGGSASTTLIPSPTSNVTWKKTLDVVMGLSKKEVVLVVNRSQVGHRFRFVDESVDHVLKGHFGFNVLLKLCATDQPKVIVHGNGETPRHHFSHLGIASLSEESQLLLGSRCSSSTNLKRPFQKRAR